MKRKVFSMILVLFAGLPSWGWISQASEVGKYETHLYQSSNPRVELKSTRSLNQATSEECYLFAFVGALEVANQNGWKRPMAPDLSPEILFMEKLQAWARDVLVHNSNLDDGFYFHRGGDVHHALKLSVEEGLWPQTAFVPRQFFANWDFAKVYADARQKLKEGKILVNRARTEDEKNQALEQALSGVKSVLSERGGHWQDSFYWWGRKWTSRQFEQQYGIQRNSMIYLMYPSGRWEMEDPWDLKRALNDLVEVFGGSFRYRQSSWNQIWKYTVNSVNSGLPVIFALSWGRTYHVMNVVGYEYDNQNRLVALKLKNSWGPEYGDRGYAYFSPQDLEKHVSTVWGFKAPASFLRN